MTVTGVEYKNASTVVSGRLTAGRFFGPENVEVGLSNGNTFKSSIGGVSMERVTAWPVLPEHDAILHLELAGSPLPLRIPEGAVVAGIGFAAEPIEGRRLANELMESPPFWASHYYLLSHDADRDETELCEELFGISPDALNEFYTSILSTNGSIMPWPYFQLRLPNSTFIEVEYADAAEYFNPYSGGDLMRAVQLVIDSKTPARRDELVAKGAVVAQRYAYETILPKWQKFLETCSESSSPAPARA